MVVLYDSSAGMLATAIRFNGTVLPAVLARSDFWLMFIFHLGLCVAYRTGYLDRWEKQMGQENALSIDWTEVKVITAMTTFFEVFYSNQCFERYHLLYKESRDIIGNTYDIIINIRYYLYHKEPLHLHLASRFLLCAVVLGFYCHVGGAVSEEEWERLLDMGLLRVQEKKYLSQYANQQHTMLLLYWSGDVTREGMENCKVPLSCLKSVTDAILVLRNEQQDLMDIMDLPIPFPYYHLLNVMVLMNLMLWGYAMAISESAFGSVIYVMAAMIFLGMMDLGNQLSDPFGEDEVDFPLDEWLNDVMVTSDVILNGRYYGNETSWAEALEAQKSMTVNPPNPHSFHLHSPPPSGPTMDSRYHSYTALTNENARGGGRKGTHCAI